LDRALDTDPARPPAARGPAPEPPRSIALITDNAFAWVRERLGFPAVRSARLGSLQVSSFLLVVGVRVAFWLLAVLAFLWAPTEQLAGGGTAMRAYDPITDHVFGVFGGWDANWFVEIAAEGYTSEQHAAFFPLFPLLVAGLGEITRSLVVAGVLVSLAAAGIAGAVLAALARPLLGELGARDTVVYFALYPIAFVFTAAYSDGLFVALAAGSFLAATRGRVWFAAILGALAVETRLIGLALLPALLVLLWPRDRSPRGLVRPAPLLLLPAAVAVYAAYLQHRLGDALAFVHAQKQWFRATPDFGPLTGFAQSIRLAFRGLIHLATDLPRIGGSYVYADRVALWQFAHLSVLLAALWLTFVAWRRLGAAYGLYSAGSILIVLTTPVTWFPLQSFPRLVLGDFPLFLALAAITASRPDARQVVRYAFVALGAIAAVLFARGAWIA
jgi:hypothetical protein